MATSPASPQHAGPRRVRRPFPPGPGVIASSLLLGKLIEEPLESIWKLKEYGDVVGVRGGPWKVVVLFNPEHLQQVLVSGADSYIKGRSWQVIKPLLNNGLIVAEGDLHRNQRRLMQPLFQPRNLGRYAAAMAWHSREVADSWSDGQTVHMHDEMVELSLRIAGITMFGKDFHGPEGELFGKRSAEAIMFYRQAVLPLSSLLVHTPLPAFRRFRRARSYIDETVYGIIADRRRGGEEGVGDLLSLMLTAHDDEHGGALMPDRQVRDEVVTLLMAGHETAASNAAFTMTLLADHPEVLARVRQEVDEVLGDREVVEYDDLARLTYLRAVITEALRLYPPGYVTVREPVRDVEIGGYRIPRGTEISIPIYHVHRDPRWWHDPDRFNPDRHLDGSDADRPRLAYLPFGSGRRICIGSAFATMELQVILATLTRAWTPELLPGYEVRKENVLTMRPEGPVPMIVRARA